MQTGLIQNVCILLNQIRIYLKLIQKLRNITLQEVVKNCWNNLENLLLKMFKCYLDNK